jgi:dihydroorotate dehydrogenase electron transfer subunit
VTVLQTFARVIENQEIIPDHRVVVFDAAAIAALARPGHFLNVFASGSYESILRKPFSVFHANPKSGEVAILFQVSGSTTIGMSRKQPGDIIDVVGPLGGKVFNPDTRNKVRHIMVGGGYGVPPLVFLAETIKAADPTADILFIVGARRKDLLLCEAELLHLGVDFRPATEDGSHGTHGRVTDVLVDCLTKQSAVYCCGPTAMMRAVGDQCTAAEIPCQVSVEVAMPCGVGVCMGCVLDLKDGRRVRSCTEGPVFDAPEVIWK